MALFHVTIERVVISCNDTELLEAISGKLDQLLANQNNDVAIAKAASDLNKSTNELDQAVKDNTPQP